MQKRKNKNKKMGQYLIIGSFLFLIGLGVIGTKLYINYFIHIKEENAIEEFFEIKNEDTQDVIVDEPVDEQVESKKESSYNYIAILEIPRIKLKRGLVAINDKNNNVNRNIEIIKGSDMPDIENGNFVLASHSGYSNISYFRNLNKMQLNDFVHVYYNGEKFNYKITNIYDVEKTGQVSISKKNNTNTLTLITCRHNTNKQIVIIAELTSKEVY
ncbi:MAG: sortase [Bacilli bacterium]|nr:sortase [Bacilli bacterium]